MCALLVKIQHDFTMGADILLEVLVLFDLLENMIHDTRDRRQILEIILSPCEPVHKVLQRFMELDGFFERNFELDLAIVCTSKNILPFVTEDLQVLSEMLGLTF